MKLNKIKPGKKLKQFLKIKPHRDKIELFKTNLTNLFSQIDETESEEFHKNIISKFLDTTYYSSNYYINTKGRNDLVIHNGKDATSKVGVIIEAKKSSNKAEMLQKDNINSKAFHELLLYYLRERITLGNLEIKHLIATNTYEWFIFDAHLFEKEFAQNKKIVKQFKDFEEKRLSGEKTDFFYKEIAEPAIKAIKTEISFTYFDIRDYKNLLKKDDKKLIALYKIFSPEHLLKLPFVNDSNSLDKSFYTELLHIIGLAEIKKGSKKLIERKSEDERNLGSLLENAIQKLDSLDIIQRVKNKNIFGETYDEKLFSVSLELSITWINRILFLKLLEAQIITYHKGDSEYSFFNLKKVRNFDDLDDLFFAVLAKLPDDRNKDVKEKFTNVPYLNSSLFEPTEIEQETIFISNLGDDKTLPIISTTILKDNNGKKQKGELNTLEYLFEFLNAYDFTSEGVESIQEENKTLINASVLGLIFEKINGYKDGSFFTPGFITMYMCRETIRRAILQKFKDAKGWDCKELIELHNKIEDKQEANIIINSLKICDPAVGSGHFLVSALNEIIAIKSELQILLDRNGKTLRDYTIEVVNDELIITDDDGELFEYHFNNKEKQRVQETLFHEKQTIIENCLFGVDINHNSVKICRLRLWIELLKNSYYKKPDFKELETLPNIDINIKCGNSLISRFPLDVNIKDALKKTKWTIGEYRTAVMNYRNAQNKEQKRKLENLISDIKSEFRIEVAKQDDKNLKLTKLKRELFNITKLPQLFERNKTEQQANKIKIKTLETKIEKQTALINAIESNKIYTNAFEWRFEFPEVLNDDGEFIGFDVLIANPPYGLFNKKQNQNIALTTDKIILDILKGLYPEATGGVVNASKIFYAFGFHLLGINGFQSMIMPYGILTDTSSSKLRKYIFNNYSMIKIEAFPERDNGKRRVFEDVKMSTAIILTKKVKSFTNFDIGISYERKIEKDNRLTLNIEDLIELNQELVQIPLTDKSKFDLLLKIYKNNSVIRIGEISQCLTGEVDMTFGKGALSNNNRDKILLKGVQIDKYVEKYKNEEISQGFIEFLNLEEFNKLYKGKKLNDALKRRIVMQGLTGVNEINRIKATIVKPEKYLANSSNYILEAKNISLEYLLSILNSSLMNFIFKTKSTSSNVNGYEVDDLPVIISKQYSNKLEILVDKILTLKKADRDADTSDLENEIDCLVYKLYGLTDEEIQIIENS